MLRSSALRPLAFLAALAALAPCAAAAAPTRDRPNIVLLVGDDHGWPYSGFMGDRIVQTPHLDELAATGTVFTHGQTTASVCVPSLRTLLAGIHSDQWDAYRDAVERLAGPQRPRTEVAYYWTLPRALAWQGYDTWEGGKLWEGTFEQAGFTHGMATAVSPNVFESVGDRFGRDGWSEGVALDPFRAFLDSTGERPFFAWIAPLLPHSPFDAPPEFQALYASRGLTAQESGYYANVSWFDAFVGRVLAELDARGLRDDTLVVYLADNGVGIHQPFAGVGQGKGTLAELGFRTPVILSWPGRVPAGEVRTDLVSEVDVPATILDYARADPIVAGGGVSLRSAIETGVPVGREKIVGHYRGNTAANSGYFVRTAIWRYVLARDGSERLYEIARDPFEQTDVAGAHPELLTQFRADVAAWQAKLGTPAERLDAAGRLTDDDGAALAGEELLLSGRARDGGYVRLRVRTGPNGEFRFSDVPHGSYLLRSERRVPLALGAVTAGAIPVTLPFGGLGTYYPLRAAGGRSGIVRPPGFARIGGVLRDERGRALAGRTVLVRGCGRRDVSVAVLSGRDGRYRAENLPADTYEVLALPRDHLQRPRVRVTLAPGEGAATVDLVARRASPPVRRRS